MSSKTEISNLALSHLGIGKAIANIETEQSEEARACRQFYETAKEAVLGDIDWNFATKFAVLGLIETDPSTEWGYSYRYPSDCISIRRILSGMRSDTQDSRVVFKILKDATGRLIYTDMENAELEYTENVNTAEFFTPEFALALSFRLAGYIASRLTAGDPFKIKRDIQFEYELEIGRARERNTNEEVNDKLPESELITART